MTIGNLTFPFNNWKVSSNLYTSTQWYMLDKSITTSQNETAQIQITFTLSPITGSLTPEQINEIREAAIAEIRLIPFPVNSAEKPLKKSSRTLKVRG